MELFIFARFHAREGDEAAVAAALRDVIVSTRAEPGCLAINAFRSIRDPSLRRDGSREFSAVLVKVRPLRIAAALRKKAGLIPCGPRPRA